MTFGPGASQRRPWTQRKDGGINSRLPGRPSISLSISLSTTSKYYLTTRHTHTLISTFLLLYPVYSLRPTHVSYPYIIMYPTTTTDTDERGREIYFCGVIDILQQYNLRKRSETFFKSFTNDSKLISSVDAFTYATRFVRFIGDNTS